MTSRSEDRMCKLTCRSFFCSKRMLRIDRKSGKKNFICKIDDSECLGYMCSYAECRERKLGDSGKCLRPIKTPDEKASKKKQISRYDSNYISPYDLDDKLRNKLTKKYKS